MKWLATVALSMLALGARTTIADTHSASYSTWVVSEKTVTLRYLLPVTTARAITGTAIPVLTTRKLGDYLLRHFDVHAGGQSCPAIDQGFDLGRVDPLSVGPSLYGFELVFACKSPSGIELHDHALFDAIPGHIDLARIERNGVFTQQLFTAGSEELRLHDKGPVPAAGTIRYSWLGVLHVLMSPDRLCLLLGLLLIVRRRRDLELGLAGLAAGYVLATGVSSFQWITPRMAELDAFVGFGVMLLSALAWVVLTQHRERAAAAMATAVLLALAVAMVITGDTPAALLLCGAAGIAAGVITLIERSVDRAPFWLLVTAVYGFVDGFVFPSELGPLSLTPKAAVTLSAGFSLGALLIQALLLVGVAGIVRFIASRELSLPRAAIGEITATALGGLGAFWLLSRLLAPLGH